VSNKGNGRRRVGGARISVALHNGKEEQANNGGTSSCGK
jgi:hypothetical protein